MKIGVLGCAGRMGRAIMAEVLRRDGMTLTGGSEVEDHPAIGQDLGLLAGCKAQGLEVITASAEVIAGADMVIEFSSPVATLQHVEIAAETRVGHVIGTTGFTGDDLDRLQAAAAKIPIMRAANMSLGINLLQSLTRQVAAALGPEDFDLEIVEIHHHHKVDAPSGTALALGEAAAEGRGVSLDEVADRGRDGITGARRPGRIGFGALRGGDIIGDHTVIFAGMGERIELAHKAGAREIYAKGAVHAARWLAGRPPGLYGMADVLGMSDH
jgi:4-hydroxy-tetrahydrodipicolinate reductase